MEISKQLLKSQEDLFKLMWVIRMIIHINAIEAFPQSKKSDTLYTLMYEGGEGGVIKVDEWTAIRLLRDKGQAIKKISVISLF